MSSIFQSSVLKNFPQNENQIAQRWAFYQEYVALSKKKTTYERFTLFGLSEK